MALREADFQARQRKSSRHGNLMKIPLIPATRRRSFALVAEMACCLGGLVTLYIGTRIHSNRAHSILAIRSQDRGRLFQRIFRVAYSQKRRPVQGVPPSTSYSSSSSFSSLMMESEALDPAASSLSFQRGVLQCGYAGMSSSGRTTFVRGSPKERHSAARIGGLGPRVD